MWKRIADAVELVLACAIALVTMACILFVGIVAVVLPALPCLAFLAGALWLLHWYGVI